MYQQKCGSEKPEQSNREAGKVRILRAIYWVKTLFGRKLAERKRKREKKERKREKKERKEREKRNRERKRSD